MPRRSGLGTIAGIEFSGNASSLLGLEADYDEDDGLVRMWLVFGFQDDASAGGSLRDWASFETDPAGMRTVHAQLGRLVARVHSDDTCEAGMAVDMHPLPGRPMQHDFDLCQPWCSNHRQHGCEVLMSLGLTAGREPRNRL